MRWNNVGVTYMRLNRKGDAVDTFKKALRMNANDPTAAENLELTWEIPGPPHREDEEDDDGASGSGGADDKDDDEAKLELENA